MMDFFKKNKTEMEKYINYFLSDLCKEYPFYINNLHKNIELAVTEMEIIRLIIREDNINFEVEIDRNKSEELVLEILDTLNLKEKFLELLKQGIIEYKPVEYSSLNSNFNETKIVICNNHNISMPISTIHEFFHYIHLEKVGFNSISENYYCYGEALGMCGEIYAVLQLLGSHEELYNELLTYINRFAYNIFIKANESLVDGTLISIYDEKKSLSPRAIKKYVGEHNISEEYVEILKQKATYERLNYSDDVRYIYSLPQALVLSYRLFSEREFHNNFLNIISELSTLDYVKWAEKYYNSYIADEEKSKELLSLLLNGINELFNRNNQKEFGGL